MARETGPKCKLCRREGVKLFLRGSRCDTAKCALERREYPPGMHSWPRRKFTAYGVHLREKQKVKRYYGLLERQFRMYFHRAERAKGNTGENLVLALERRFDNVVALLGLALSRNHARQLVRHGHFLINSRRVTLPGREISVGDQITVANRERSKTAVLTSLEAAKSRAVPGWLELSTEPLVAKMTRPPTREEVSLPIQEQLIVELLSK